MDFSELKEDLLQAQGEVLMVAFKVKKNAPDLWDISIEPIVKEIIDGFGELNAALDRAERG